MKRIETDIDATVMTITLADEQHRNVLSAALMAELVAALDEAESNPTIRVIVLTHRGHVFCAGADLAASRGQDGPRGPNLGEICLRLQHSPKPVVARIAGHCVAGGMGLIASADIAIASESAMFGFSEVRVGVVPAIIALACLPKMRRADAANLFLRGTRFPADDAVRFGLIQASVPAEDLDRAVGEAVSDLVAGGPEAIAMTKRLLNESEPADDATRYTRAAELSSRIFASAEAAEGMAAFREKRAPIWNVARHLS